MEDSSRGGSMKALVISLLRVGDLFMHAEWIRGFKAQYPKAEIHLLLNDSSAGAIPLIHGVDRVYSFPRKDLQKILVEQAQNPRRAKEIVSEILETLSGESYDRVYNLTHNRLSGYVAGQIPGAKKLGLALRAGAESAKFENAWLSYLNHHFSEDNGSRFHYVDILHRAFEISPRRIVASRDEAGAGTILIQPLTSDERKNWGLERFQELVNLLKASRNQGSVKILGAPFEASILKKYFSEGDLLICDFQVAASHLKKASVLVSGDTSLIHLASLVGCPVFGVFVGYSDPRKTAPWGADTALVQETRAESIHVSNVYEQISSFLRKKGKTTMTTQWFGQRDLLRLKKQESSYEEVLFEFESEVWSFYLDQKNLEQIPPYRTTVRQYADQFLNEISAVEQNQLAHQFSTQAKQIGVEVHALLQKCQQMASLTISAPVVQHQLLEKAWTELREWNEQFRQRWSHYRDQNDRLTRALEAQPTSAFEAVRLVKAAIEEIQNLTEVRIYLTNELTQLIGEKGQSDVRKTEIHV